MYFFETKFMQTSRISEEFVMPEPVSDTFKSDDFVIHNL